MNKRNKILYICVVAILIFILLVLIIKLFPVYKLLLLFVGRLFLPFIIAAFISYLLYPILLKLHEYKMSKGFAVLLIYFLFFAILTIVIYKSFPVFVHQLQDLSEQLPQFVYVYEEIIYNLYESTSFLPEIVHDKMDDFIIRTEQSIEAQIEKVLEKLANIFDFFIILTIIPVLVFYFLKDFTQMKSWFRKKFSEKHYQNMEKVLVSIDESLGGYVRGQLIISAAITLLTFIIYHTLQLKYALLLAVIMGLVNVIPYFGPIIGTVPAVAIAMTTSWKLVIIILITNAIVQIIENSFLSPYIMGKSVRIHPVVIIFTLLVGAEVGGIIGMIVAVPVITILRAIFIQVFQNKQQCN